MITTALRAGTELLSPWKGVGVLSLCPSPWWSSRAYLLKRRDA